jgi:hypothetical protein
MDYKLKYLKYKEKYLDLKNQSGGVLDDNQIRFHKLLKKLDENNWIFGPINVHQWVNTTNPKLPRTVTMFGEIHRSYYEIRDCNTRIKGDPNPVENKGIPDLGNLADVNDFYSIDNIKKRTDNLKMLYHLFKGTQTCIDFYLEDWYNNNNLGKILNDTPDFKDPVVINQYPVFGYTIPNLNKITNNDMKQAPVGHTRIEYKQFNNVRMHYTEFRNEDISHIILPYSSGNEWEFSSNYNIQNVFNNKINFLIQNPIWFNGLLVELRKLFFLISGMNPGFVDIGNDVNYFIDREDNFIQINEKFDLIYIGILKNYYRLHTAPPAGLPKIGPNYHYVPIAGVPQPAPQYLLTAEFNNLLGLNPDNITLAPRIGLTPNQLAFRDDLDIEMGNLKRLMRKNLKNFKKYDVETRNKCTLFFESYLNFPIIFQNMITLNDHNLFNSTGRIEFLRYLEVTYIDIYTILRSLKIFSLSDQDNNLRQNSLCYNEFNYNSRNILYYHGAAHTQTYYLFWSYFFGRMNDYSLVNNFMFYNKYRAYFSNLIVRTNIAANPYRIEKANFNNNLNNYIDQHYILRRNLRANYNPQLSQAIIELGNIDILDNNNASTGTDYSCLNNTNNIFKKILINISKNTLASEKLINSINYKRYDIIRIQNNIIKYVQDIISKVPLLNNDFNNNRYDHVIDENFNINSNPVTSLFHPNNRNLIQNIIINDNIITFNEFRQNILIHINPNPVLPPLGIAAQPLNPILHPRFKDDKKALEGLVTNFFVTKFLKNDKIRLEFVIFVKMIYNSVLKQWHETRLQKIMQENVLAFTGVPGGVLTQKIIDDNKKIVKFIYKGGMPLRILYLQLKKQFSIGVENKINEIFSSEFKLSDNDFQLIIKTPHIYKTDNDLVRQARISLYNKVYYEIQILNYIILREIRNIFNDETQVRYFFTYFQENTYHKGLLLRDLLSEINSQICLDKSKNLLDYTFRNIKNDTFDTILINKDSVYPPENYDDINGTFINFNSNQVDLEDYDNSKNNIMLINPTNNLKNQISNILNIADLHTLKFVYNGDKLLDNITKDVYNKGDNGSFYVSYNPDIQVGITKFSLSRMKYNFRLYGSTVQDQNIFINLGAEVIDVSIGHYQNNKYYEYDILDDHDYKKYNIYNESDANTYYESYSVRGFLHDLFFVLFKGTTDINIVNMFPENYYGLVWNDNKYNKRINRILFLSYMEIFNPKIDNILLRKNNDELLRIYKKLYHIFKKDPVNNTPVENKLFQLTLITDLCNLIKTDLLTDINSNSINVELNGMITNITNVINNQPIVVINYKNRPINETQIYNNLRRISCLNALIYYIIKMIYFNVITVRNNMVVNDADILIFNRKFNDFKIKTKFSIGNIIEIHLEIMNDIIKENKTILLNKINVESF